MIKVWMVFWSVGRDFQFKLYFQHNEAFKFMQESKVKTSDNHRMMEIELHGDPQIFVCTHDSDNFRHIVFFNKEDAEKWLETNDSGLMDVHKAWPGDVT